MLFRQYVRDNLYDRISTRPFLNNTREALDQASDPHSCEPSDKSGVGLGDIKTENVMVTNWNCPNGFCQFQAHLPSRGQPGRFSTIFLTLHGGELAYIAPECFVDGGLFATELEYMRDPSTPLVDLNNSNQNKRRIEASNGYLFSRYLN